MIIMKYIKIPLHPISMNIAATRFCHYFTRTATSMTPSITPDSWRQPSAVIYMTQGAFLHLRYPFYEMKFIYIGSRLL